MYPNNWSSSDAPSVPHQPFNSISPSGAPTTYGPPIDSKAAPPQMNGSSYGFAPHPGLAPGQQPPGPPQSGYYQDNVTPLAAHFDSMTMSQAKPQQQQQQYQQLYQHQQPPPTQQSQFPVGGPPLPPLPVSSSAFSTTATSYGGQPQVGGQPPFTAAYGAATGYANETFSQLPPPPHSAAAPPFSSNLPAAPTPPQPVPPSPAHLSTGFPPMNMMPPMSGPPGPQYRSPSASAGPPPMPPQPGGLAPAPTAPSSRAMADNMPSAVEVIANDRAQRSGVFQTGPVGVTPPLVTTDFVCKDEGNCNPRFMRSSLYAVPTSSGLLKSVGLPFVLTVEPFAELHPEDQYPILCDLGPQGPVRCIRCKAYMCPSFTFIDGGRRFQCSLCGASTDVPEGYFAHLDHTGRRVDAYQRAELCLGSYELVATKEYCKNDELPQPPAFIFLLDVSQAAIRSGLVSLFCSRFITEILPSLPCDEHGPADAKCPLSIGFITYDNQLHFYSLVRSQSSTVADGESEAAATTTCLTKPQMNVVADISEVFVPAVQGFLVPPDPALLTNLLSTIPSQFSIAASQGAASPDPILGPAIQAGLEALKAAGRCGKLFVLHSSLPTAEAPGRLKHREDRHVIGTDREKTLLQPATDFYTTLGKQCVEAGCSVDLFLFPNSYIDVATLAEVPRLTSGNLFKYNCFQADLQGDQFISDLRTAVSQPKAFDAVMRIRTSTGTRPFEFLGNFNQPNTTDVELAAIDKNTAVTCEVRHDDKLPDNDLVLVQAAILYTSLSGQRRLRVHNLALSTSSNASDVYRLADLDTYMNWLSKTCLQAAVARTSAQIVADVTAKVAHTLAGYRRLCAGGAQGASPGELVLPETIKLLPLYAQCLFKLDAIRPARNSTIDDRCYMMYLLNGMGVEKSSKLIYPTIIPLHSASLDPSAELPAAIRCSYERLLPDSAYFIHNGILALLWLGPKIDPAWIQQIFGVNDVSMLESEKAKLVEQDNPVSKSICQAVFPILNQFSHCAQLRVTRQGDLSEAWVKRLMYEDRDDCSNASYVEYLCHIHKEVRSLLK
ncbi:hypothetical protein AAHC03_023028 [Spirometra sp. Aus1]